MGSAVTEQALRRTSRFDAVRIDGDFLLFDGETLQLMAGPAAQIWELIDGVRGESDIAEELARQHPESAAQVVVDVTDFLASLLLRGLIEVTDRPAAYYRRPEHVGWAWDAQEVLLIDMGNGQRRALTSSGACIWEAVDELGDLAMVVGAVREQFPDAPPTLADDVQRLLDELVEAGFLLRLV